MSQKVELLIDLKSEDNLKNEDDLKNAAKRDNAGAVCNSGMGMLFLYIYFFTIISLRGVLHLI